VQSLVRTQPVATPGRFRVRPATDPQLIPSDQTAQDDLGDNIVEQVESEPGHVTAPVPQQAKHKIMAEDRVLLPRPFSGSADKDLAEF